jgi:hypothetical protein
MEPGTAPRVGDVLRCSADIPCRFGNSAMTLLRRKQKYGAMQYVWRAWREVLASPKFLLRRALACAKLARETSDDDCRARCLRLEQVYRQLAQSDGGLDAPAAIEPHEVLRS